MRNQRVAAAEVRTPDKDRTGGTPSMMDAEVMDREAPVDMATFTAAARLTGVDSTTVGMEDRTEATAAMGVHMGFNGTLPTLSITKTYSGSSAKNRLTTMEVGQTDSREGG